MRAPSQENLAAALNLSRTTVSRSLSNHPAIAAETRERVLKMARKLGYRASPVRVVRKPRSAKPPTIGVLIGQPLVETDNLSLPLLLAGMQHRAKSDHVAVDIVNCDASVDDPQRGHREIFRRIRREGWRGAILIYPFPEALVARLARKISIVSVLHEYHETAVDVVDTDHGDVRLLVNRLIAAGHRRFGFVSWSYAAGGLWAQHRFAAFSAALQVAGLTPEPRAIFNINRTPAAQRSPEQIHAEAITLTQAGAVTAWVCAADHQAYPLIGALQAAGCRVPDMCSVTGFDGNPPPGGVPALASLSVPHEHIGASALARLLSRLLHAGSPRRQILVATGVLPGATIGPAFISHEKKQS